MNSFARPRLILLVEDDRSVRSMAKRSLENASYRVVAASDGQAGYDAFIEHRPDLVLLDVVMPHMSGFEVFRAIRAMPAGATTPILMMTSLDDVESIHEAFAAGATDFVSKPLSWALLPYRVQYLLRGSDMMQELRRSERRLDDAQRAARLGYWDWSIGDDQLILSPMSASFFGEGASERIANISDLLQRVDRSDRDRFSRALQRVVMGGAPLSFDFRLMAEEGEPLWLHASARASTGSTRDGVMDRVVIGTFQDISEIKKREAQTRYLAYFDTLTGLPNRANLTEQLETRLTHARRHERALAVIVIDLDNFKRVNETLGRANGDRLLSQLATRLRHSVRTADSLASLSGVPETPTSDENERVACMGGDEFAIIVDEISGLADVEQIARRLQDVIRQPATIDGGEVVVSSSIGIAMYPEDGEHATELLAHADSAMHEAKNAGGDRLVSFSAPLCTAAKSRFSHEMGLRRALERQQLSLQYQPKMDLVTGRIVGLEALLRWNHPEFGAVSPAHFIPIAEQTGIIVEISEWVLRTALAQIGAWRREGINDVCVAINLSAKHFTSPGLVEHVSALLNEYGIDPTRIELEVTEGAIMRDVERALETSQQLRQLGCRVAIDDFGTGYSSLAYLKQLSVDHLKIDRSFITGLAEDSNDAAIVRSIVEMANVLGMRVIAEGVETREQLQQLVLGGCHEVQGFLISRPIPSDAVPPLLTASAQMQRVQLLLPPVAGMQAHSSSSDTSPEYLS
ncbi:MAG: putative bifunctional diguanylate cyclase/phosphodiesterase [Gemmatimonas sp.]